MSILVGLDHQEEPEKERDEELLVFGYACRLRSDAETAIKEESGALLIPWMGERSLMIDRYDGRAHLSDKTMFCLKPNIAKRLMKEEEELEVALDEERYLSLNRDIMEEELMKEEEEKRMCEALQPEGYYTAVGYEYTESKEDPAPKPPPAPPMSSVLVDQSSEDDAFVLPEGLSLPAGMATPSTKKLHAIMEKTAMFIVQRGPQVEIVIKAKQKHNPYFAFLDFEDHLNPYYKHLLQALRTQAYIPQPPAEPEAAEDKPTPVTANDSPTKKLDETDPVHPARATALSSGDESDGECELHPLLRVGLQSNHQTSLSTASASSRSESFVTSEHRLQQASSLLQGAPWNQPTSEQSTMSTTTGSAYEDYYKYWSQAWAQYYTGGGGGGTQSQHTQIPSAGATSADYSAYAAMAQYHQYYAALYSQYLQSAGASDGPTPQQAKHPYEEALAQLPQSVLDQPPNPPPPNLQPVVDKMAEYAANNGEEFERTVLEKNNNDPRFSFLRPGNEYHAYYTTKKLLYITKLREASERQKEAAKAAVHSLKPDGSVGFALGGNKLQMSNVVLEDSSSGEEKEEEEGLMDGVEVASEKKRKKPPSKLSENDTAVAVDNPQSLEDREKQIERRRKAALFIEELRRKRELQLEEEKETGLNEDSDEFVGPKRRPLEL